MASAVHEQHIGGEGFRQRHLMRVVGRRWAMSRILVLLAFLFPVAAGVERCCRCSSSAWLQITLSPACATLILNYTNHSTTPNTIDNASFQLLPTSSPPSVSSVVFREQSYSSSSYPSTAKAVLTGGSTIYLRSSSAGECDSNHAQCPSACTDVGGCCPDPTPCPAGTRLSVPPGPGCPVCVPCRACAVGQYKSVECRGGNGTADVTECTNCVECEGEGKCAGNSTVDTCLLNIDLESQAYQCQCAPDSFSGGIEVF
eukprot:CAMPEP_0172025194 /NCGR_PEP_ID=MMETSP1041-20130122/15759_1 /TAXON_ID=464988 /ORGANISM="Hemiselmis andersenii, Strain CCMP439" /LENGTH=256 /DNA_ID=CAMNT_0012680857 /DNA_START=46 /DNA_END=813 /DNA_ORIENTATION=+